MSTLNPILSSDATLETLRQTLRNLNTPAKLSDSPWAASILVTKRHQENPSLSASQAVQTILGDILKRLEAENKAYADLLHGRFWENLRVVDMMRADRPYAMEERTFYLQQQAALQHFATLLLAQEQASQQARLAHRLLARLPMPTYDRLFGVDAITDELLHYLRDPQRYLILSIKGIGGIGKTALANYAVRRFLAEDDTLHDLVWISAKQEYLTPSGIYHDIHGGSQSSDGIVTQIRLEQLFDELGQKLGMVEVLRLPVDQKIDKLAVVLRKTAHLVIIDNLETVADFNRLTPWLARLAGPTKFLLTSREIVPSLMQVTPVALNQLDRQASRGLIEATAQLKNVGDCDAGRIYELVGGNPLAIILLVSQMQFLPPAEVLKNVQLGATKEIYRYIYWKSWRALSLPAQAVLFAIQRAGDVADWDWLAMVTDFPTGGLQAALSQLLDFSLVQPQRNNEGQRAFAIHRLTSTFLRTEVLGWK